MAPDEVEILFRRFELLLYRTRRFLAEDLTTVLYTLQELAFGKHLGVKSFYLQCQPCVRPTAYLRVSDSDARTDNSQDDYEPEDQPPVLPALFLGNDRSKRCFSLQFLPLGLAHCGPQAVIRRLLAELCPDTREELSGFEGDA
ncbi:MAG: hypothetical protein DMG72_24560 [Acidobacteria bacterium]|nr:MAG: hypothetical protein DMG72_24560 [Acidobacteriota bacterium]